jgi:O-acetyl-ADP-ribose deacetylase (regulator of RNase III)
VRSTRSGNRFSSAGMRYADTLLEVLSGDITKADVGAVVNAANSSLLGGGGVDGAIHRAAGPDLVHECRLLGGCKTGQAKITKGYRLKARYIIHTVGPVWRGGEYRERELLAGCYRSCLELATLHGVMSVAFPAISTGIYKFPVAEAAAIAVQSVVDYLDQAAGRLEKIVFVCFDQMTAGAYQQSLASLSGS